MSHHGMSKTKFYRTWSNMIQRCANPNSTKYHLYGGRGIKVCERWKTFKNFYEDMYEKYLEHARKHSEILTTLDRIDGDKGYKPSNCRWATYSVQNSNRMKRSQTPGVTKWRRKWKAQLYRPKDHPDGYGYTYLGLFNKEKEAAKAVNKAQKTKQLKSKQYRSQSTWASPHQPITPITK